MKTRSSLTNALHYPALALLLVACGGPVPPSEESSSEEALASYLEGEPLTCEPLDAELAEEACFHGENGPFKEVSAAALNNPLIPNVNLPHTAYNITLPVHSTFGYAGSVTYRPVEDGEYAFFLSRHRAFKIYDGTTVVSRECSYTIGDTTCASLRRMVTADLEAGKVYRLEFKAVRSANASFTLIVEEAAHHHEEEEPLP
ncbi:MAG TPA: hypothetical protein VF815_12020 [Myxococcaceae bacterium]|jgi:hypothetical protein